MKKSFLAIIAGFLLVFCTAPEEPALQPPVNDLDPPINENPPNPQTITNFVFTKANEFPASGRKNAFSFVIGDKFYVGTGEGTDESGYTLLDDFWEYDTRSDIWTEKAKFPLGKFRKGAAIAYNGKGYVLFGETLNCIMDQPCDFIFYRKIHAYDPENDSWEEVAELEAIPSTYGGHITLVNNKAMFVDTFHAYEISLDNFLYEKKPVSPIPIDLAAAFKIGNRIYYFGGLEGGVGSVKTMSYDTQSGEWAQLSDFPGVKRYGSVSFAKDGFGYVIGGKESDIWGQNQQFKEIWQFDPKDSNWKKVSDYPGEGISEKILQMVNGQVFIGFGSKSNAIRFEKDFWKLELK
jgi:N-acetylneuraminic acid mutarotase